MYAPNMLGLGGPRQLTLLLPGLTKDDFIRPLPYRRGHSRLHEMLKGDGITEIIVLRNKSPQWNEGNRNGAWHPLHSCA